MWNGFDWRRSEKCTDRFTELETVKVGGSNIIGLQKWVGPVPPTYNGSDAHGIKHTHLIPAWHFRPFSFDIKGVVDCFFLGLIVFNSLTCVNASLKKKKHTFSHNLPLFYTALSLLLWTLWWFPGFMKPLPQKYTMGSDWLAGPVCCDLLNCLVQSRNVAPLTSAACALVLYCEHWCHRIVNIAYQFEPDWDPENISEEDRAEPVQARLLQDVSEWYVFFVCCCLILLDMLLFVNATAYVSF